MDVVKLERGSECETSALPSLRNVQTIYIKCESHTTAVSPVVLQGDTKEDSWDITTVKEETKEERETEGHGVCLDGGDGFSLEESGSSVLPDLQDSESGYTTQTDIYNENVLRATTDATKPTIIRRSRNCEQCFECEFCHKPFSRYGCLCKLQLANSVHKTVICDICGKGLSETRNLINHRRSHTGEKPFECGVCGKAFASCGNLVRHQHSHAEDKPFKCDVCGKGFTQKSNVAAHQRLHTGVDLFKCDFCSKTFTVSSALVRHRRSHTGEKPFKCDICGKSFSVSGSVARHRRTHCT